MALQQKTPKIILPLVIVIITVAAFVLIRGNPPENKRSRPSSTPQMTVQTQTLEAQNYAVMIQSFGTVQPRTQSALFAQVSGQINQISEQFRDGGFFEKGDTLVQLDDRDYRAEVKISEANLMSAKQSFQEEKARVQQAKADWLRLGNGKQASALVLRQPQLEAAQAKLLSTEAQLEKAELALERTTIIAPYAGRILKKNVDIGQVISSNTALANIYATDSVEVRLPIKNKDLPLMHLQEEYRNTDKTGSDNALSINVKLSSNLMGEQSWQGNLVRTESAIDTATQQLYVVAQIVRPYDLAFNNGAQIKIGQYVTAEIKGKTVDNALIIPSSAIYQGSYVYIVEKGVLKRKNIVLGWQNGTESMVTEGLSANDELVLTPLGQVNSGTPVAVEGQERKGAKSLKNMPKARKEKLKKIAKEKGITVEELIAQRKMNKGARPPKQGER